MRSFLMPVMCQKLETPCAEFMRAGCRLRYTVAAEVPPVQCAYWNGMAKGSIRKLALEISSSGFQLKVNDELIRRVIMATSTVVNQKVVSRAEWLAARKTLLAKEKELTRSRDELNRQRLELHWVKVEKNYVFDTPNGKKNLAELFDGRSQLIIYHFMFGPGWGEGCVGCSFLSDHVDGVLPHLQQRDVSYVAVSRA